MVLPMTLARLTGRCCNCVRYESPEEQPFLRMLTLQRQRQWSYFWLRRSFTNSLAGASRRGKGGCVSQPLIGAVWGWRAGEGAVVTGSWASRCRAGPFFPQKGLNDTRLQRRSRQERGRDAGQAQDISSVGRSELSRLINSEMWTTVWFLYLLCSDYLLTGSRPDQISCLTEHIIITKSQHLIFTMWQALG